MDSFAAPWMDLECIMQSDISQKERNRHRTISNILICDKYIQEGNNKRLMVVEMENWFLVGRLPQWRGFGQEEGRTVMEGSENCGGDVCSAEKFYV